MTCVLGIDPGLDTGWAIITNGQLTNAGLGDPRIFDGAELTKVIIECPRVYPHNRVDPNDLITLALQVGAYKECFRSVPVTLIHPQKWKAQLPKEITMSRMCAKYPGLRGFLDAAPKSKQHNISDACGIADYGYTRHDK